MNFFEHQEAANRTTGRLVALFALAVVCIVLAVYAAFMLIFGFADENASVVATYGFWHPQMFAACSLGTLAVILGGSAYKTAALSSGGEAVARTVGGRLVARNTSDPDERKILNVVDEMAIASGVPCPPVYVLENERSINAFAAGYTPDDAVIGVTRGCIELLNRDELQGVIAHEFSHILHGDMRLNIRLMGVLHGILLLALVGYFILRGGMAGGRSRRRRSSKEGGGALAILALGLALIVIGYIGVFFAKLIKSAVSRQREYLADAVAVQFTRNPDGIAGALKKIGGYLQGSRLKHPQAEQASHLYFGNGLGTPMLNLLATHPPLEERIRRIDPSFDGRFPRVESLAADRRQSEPEPRSRRETLRSFATPDGRAAWKAAFTPDLVMQHLGSLAPGEMSAASAVLASLPQDWKRLIYEPYGARVLVYVLLLDDDEDVRKAQLGTLAECADSNVYLLTRRLANADPVALESRLPLLELCIPALRELSPTQYRGFRRCTKALIEADSRVGLFEFVLHRTLKNHLDPQFRGQSAARRVQYKKLEPLLPEMADLLSGVAHAGARDENAAETALRAAASVLSEAAERLELQPEDANLFVRVDRALSKLAYASLPIKQRTVQACATAIESDGTTTVQERELLRAICESLGCPIPPLAGEPVPVVDAAPTT